MSAREVTFQAVKIDCGLDGEQYIAKWDGKYWFVQICYGGDAGAYEISEFEAKASVLDSQGFPEQEWEIARRMWGWENYEEAVDKYFADEQNGDCERVPALELDDLARQQGVKPVQDVRSLGRWPGKIDDGFEEFVEELRHGK
jgi:hypothetical protein